MLSKNVWYLQIGRTYFYPTNKETKAWIQRGKYISNNASPECKKNLQPNAVGLKIYCNSESSPVAWRETKECGTCTTCMQKNLHCGYRPLTSLIYWSRRHKKDEAILNKHVDYLWQNRIVGSNRPSFFNGTFTLTVIFLKMWHFDGFSPIYVGMSHQPRRYEKLNQQKYMGTMLAIIKIKISNFI